MYVGEWNAGEMNGKGKYNYSNGTVYEGQFKSNKRHGRGAQRDTNGTLTEGEWEDDKYLHSLVVSDALNALRSMPKLRCLKLGQSDAWNCYYSDGQRDRPASQSWYNALAVEKTRCHGAPRPRLAPRQQRSAHAC